MNWKATGVVLAIVGAVTAAVGWLWSHSIHEQRHECRVRNLYPGSRQGICPSKMPAVIVAGVGGVVLVIAIALIIGAATSKSDN